MIRQPHHISTPASDRSRRPLRAAVSFIVLSFGLLFMAGCYSAPASVKYDASVRVRTEQAALVGVWSAIWGEDAIAHSGYQAINIRADGSAELVYTFLRRNARYWVVAADCRLEGDPDTGWSLRVVSPTVVLAQSMHSKMMSGYYQTGEIIPLVPTQHGLVLDAKWKNLLYYRRESAESVPTVTTFAVRKNRELRASYGLPEIVAPANNSHLFAMAGAMQLGMGASAMQQGNQAAAHMAFESAQRSAMAGLAGQRFDTAAAFQDALQTGYALGSGGTPPPSNLQTAIGALAPAQPPQGGPGDVTPGMVELTSAEIGSYTDGYAYNIQTIAPKGGSAGEFIIMYGVPVSTARSFLATGYGLAAERSAYGPGNPQQTISWERHAVKQGDRIKMGAVWQDGRMPWPEFTNLYHIRKTIP